MTRRLIAPVALCMFATFAFVSPPARAQGTSAGHQEHARIARLGATHRTSSLSAKSHHNGGCSSRPSASTGPPSSCSAPGTPLPRTKKASGGASPGPWSRQARLAPFSAGSLRCTSAHLAPGNSSRWSR